MSSDATVYVVDDDQALRTSLQWLLEGAGLRVRTFAAAQPCLQALDALEAPPTGCALVDLRLPGMSGLELLEQLARRPFALPVIMITGHGDVAAAVQAMKTGAFDFIEKPFDEQHLLGQVRDALRAGADRRRSADDRAALRERFERLSPRERQVMKMIVNGWLNKQIAAEFGLSPKTVEVHRAHVMEKMQAPNFAELVRMGVALELVQTGVPAKNPTLHSG